MEREIIKYEFNSVVSLLFMLLAQDKASILVINFNTLYTISVLCEKKHRRLTKHSVFS
jgi:hypothetical protein